MKNLQVKVCWFYLNWTWLFMCLAGNFSDFPDNIYKEHDIKKGEHLRPWCAVTQFSNWLKLPAGIKN